MTMLLLLLLFLLPMMIGLSRQSINRSRFAIGSRSLAPVLVVNNDAITPTVPVLTVTVKAQQLFCYSQSFIDYAINAAGKSVKNKCMHTRY